MNRRMITRLFVIAFVCVACVGAIGGYRWLFVPPLFHAHFGFHERSLVPEWNPLRPIADRHGAYGFADYRRNMFVVIVTERAGHFDLPFGAGRSSCTLLRDTVDQVEVNAMPNTILVIREGRRASGPLAPGTAKAWHDKFFNLDTGEQSLAKLIAENYDGTNEIRDLLSR